MQLIFDNLAALLVFTTLMIILLVVNQRSQESAIEETSFSALRQGQVSFVQTLERDISGMYRVDTVSETADSTFSFWTRIGDSSDTLRVVYRRTRVGQRSGTDLFQIVRYESRTGIIDRNRSAGGSMATIAEWNILGLNRAGNRPDRPADVRQIRVQFETMTPFETGNKLIRHPWERTFFPLLLGTNRL